MIHNGNTLPNFISFEYLISQQVIPIVNKIWEIEKDALKGFEPHYFKTQSCIDIIQKFTSKECKFTLDDINNKNNIIRQLLLIGHLKELGRANFSQDYFIKKNIKYDEPGCEDPAGRNIGFASLEEKKSHVYKRMKCNCCNIEALVVYKIKKDFDSGNGNDFTSWFRCFNCDYSLNMNMFDPFDFDLASERIFPI